LWGHPHTALLPLLRSPLHILTAFSRQQNGPFVATTSETKSAGHAYQLCQPSNGRTDRTEEIRIKGGLSELQSSCECRWRRTSPRKDPCSASAANASATHRATVATHPEVLLVVRLTFQGSAPTHSSSLSAVAAEETTQLTTGAVQNGRRPRRRLLSGRILCAARWGVHPAPRHPKAQRLVPTAEQERLEQGWNHVIRGGRVIKAASPPSPNFTPCPVTPSPTRNELETTGKKGKTAKSTPKVKVGPKQAPANEVTKPAKPKQPSQTTPMNPVAPTQTNHSPIEISDLLDKLPLNACVELTRRLLTSISTLPTGSARTRAVLKVVILFVAQYGSTTHTD
jgi:hypothetical protein